MDLPAVTDIEPGDVFAGHRVEGIALIAPHFIVEDISVASIAEIKTTYETTNLKEKLSRWHKDADNTFSGWNDAWLAPAFRAWNIVDEVARIRIPILAIQGEDDEYGTLEQVYGIRRAAPQTELLVLPGCGHTPHRDLPDAVADAASRFISTHSHQSR